MGRVANTSSLLLYMIHLYGGRDLHCSQSCLPVGAPSQIVVQATRCYPKHTLDSMCLLTLCWIVAVNPRTLKRLSESWCLGLLGQTSGPNIPKQLDVYDGLLCETCVPLVDIYCLISRATYS